MAAQQRELLEQLMRAPEARLDDPGICKSFCVAFCVHDLFEKTRQVSGPCPFQHIKKLQREYQAGKRLSSFEHIFKTQLDRCLNDCNARIEAAKLKLEPAEIDAELVAKAKAVQKSSKLVSLLQTEVKHLARIDPDRALEEAKKIKAYQLKHLELLKEFDALYFSKAPSGHQKLIICEVCGSSLSSQETDHHLAGHFAGKLHTGFLEVRKARKKIRRESLK